MLAALALAPACSDETIPLSLDDSLDTGVLAGDGGSPSPGRLDAGSAARLVAPSMVDFGEVDLGACPSRSSAITLHNDSPSALTVQAIRLHAGSEAGFSLSSIPSLPATFGPGERITFEARFRPVGLGEVFGAIEVSFQPAEGEAEPHTVVLRAASRLDTPQVDEFEVLGPPRVDLLFVLDGTPSMADEQDALAENLGAFLQFAEAQGVDYQLGVISADGSGTLRATSAGVHFVTPETTPSPLAVLRELADVGTNDPEPALGAASARAALSEPALSTVNRGFVRSDATLSVVFVSDGADGSAGTVEEDVAFFFSIKGFRNTQLFSASAITAPVPPGHCAGLAGRAETDGRLLELARRTGGIFQSICTAEWSRSLEGYATWPGRRGWTARRLFLSNQPIVETIEVFVDDVARPERTVEGEIHWRYDFATNAISFAPFARPEPDARIRIEYAAECL